MNKKILILIIFITQANLISNGFNPASGLYFNITVIQNDPPMISLEAYSENEMNLFNHNGLTLPLDGELSTYQLISSVGIFQHQGVEITAIEHDNTDNIFILANFDTAVLNFTETGFNTNGSQTQFISGTPSIQSSFLLCYNSINEFKFGKELDFDDDYDYFMKSMEITEYGDIVLLSLKNPVSLDYDSQETDVTLLKLSSDLQNITKTSFGGNGREILGIPEDSDMGVADLPTDLLEIDSEGNVVIAGVTYSDIFHPESDDPRKDVLLVSEGDIHYVNSLGSDGIGPGQVHEAIGVSYNETHIFAGDWGNGKVEIFDLEGKYESQLLMPTLADFPLTFVKGLVANSTHVLVLCEYTDMSYQSWEYRVNIFDSAGNQVKWFGYYGANENEFTYLWDIDMNDTHIFVAEGGDMKVFDLAGNFVTFFGSQTRGVAVNDTHILSIDYANHRVQVYDSKFVLQDQFGSSGTGNGQFMDISGIAIHEEYIYVGDATLDRVQIFDLAGNFVSVLGVSGSGDGQMNLVRDISVNKYTGEIYVAEGLNSRIQVFEWDSGQFEYSLNLMNYNIDKISPHVSAPTLEELLDYEAIFLYSAVQYYDSTFLGNTIADYIDQGGFVVLDSNSFSNRSSAEIYGRFGTEEYNPMDQGYNDGIVRLYNGSSQHDFVTGTDGYYSYSIIATISNGSELVASYEDGVPFVSIKGNVLSINTRPIYSDIAANFALISHLAIRSKIMEYPTLFVLKTTDEFEYVSSRLIQSKDSASCFTTSLALDDYNNIYLGGSSKSRFNLNGSNTPYRSVNFVQDQDFDGNGSIDDTDLGLSGSAYIISLNSTLHMSSLTTLGGIYHSAIYDLEYNNSRLYAAGQSLSTDLVLNPNIDLQVLQPSNGSGFIAEFNPIDWNLYYYQSFGDPQVEVEGSVIWDIDLQSDNIYYSGGFHVDTLLSEFTGEGIFAKSDFASPLDNKIPLVGILDDTQQVVFSTLLPSEIGSLSPITVRNSTGELLWITSNSSSIQIFYIEDTDHDGLSNYNEITNYGSNPSSIDSDEDGLEDPVEIYVYNTLPYSSDTDFDCLPDGWEVENGFNPVYYDANTDLDNDGLNAIDEINAGTSFLSNDTDSDGISDYEEYMIYQTNGSNVDTDSDGLNDAFEIFNSFTDPSSNDTDLDRLSDSDEILNEITICDTNNANCVSGYTDPLEKDMDVDGLTDYEELIMSVTVPWNPDTDDDGLTDFEEYYYYGTNGWSVDTDGDTLNDTFEIIIIQTDPNDPDCDDDGLDDAYEIFISQTDPKNSDTDGDGLNDAFEVNISGTHPLYADYDNDTLNDFVEVNYGSNSTNPDSDGDLLPDYWEYRYSLDSSLNETYLDFDSDKLNNLMEYYNATNPVKNDTDDDGLDDFSELVNGTDPNSMDTDDDMLLDGQEVLTYGTDPLMRDTDQDQLIDSVEIFVTFSDPLSFDTDGDGLSDYDELFYHTLVLVNDTDNDNLTDAYEIFSSFTNPLMNDTDLDGLDDYSELFIYYLDPNNPDMDEDTILDGEEIYSGYDPMNPDTDGDLIFDGKELELGTDVLNNDTDSDGLSDGLEVFTLNSDPNASDTDEDGMNDLYEAEHGLKISVKDDSEDPDSDGLTNIREMNLGTDPRNSDSDEDGYVDGYEVDHGMDPLTFNDPPAARDRIQGGIEESPWLAGAALTSFIGSISLLMVQLVGRRFRK
ncbi:MAG: 6-bladed beta-propeller [Candidatus Heimdallarchaeota archaeon]|nr:6-bladed beta-propeller [Candidatus Heimdallarchaeota archaeon]